MVRTMMAKGINFNNTICNIIIKKDGTEEDLVNEVETFKAQREKD